MALIDVNDSLNYLLSGSTTDGQQFSGKSSRDTVYLTNNKKSPTSTKPVSFTLAPLNATITTQSQNLTLVTVQGLPTGFDVGIPVQITGTNIIFNATIVYKAFNVLYISHEATPTYTGSIVSVAINKGSTSANRWFTDMNVDVTSDSTSLYISASCAYSVSLTGTISGDVKVVRSKLKGADYVEDAVIYSKAMTASDLVNMPLIKDDVVDGNYRYEILFDIRGVITQLSLTNRNLTIMAVKV